MKNNILGFLTALCFSTSASAAALELDTSWNIEEYSETLASTENDGDVKLQEAYVQVLKQIAEVENRTNFELPYEVIDLKARCEGISAFKQCNVKALVKWGDRNATESRWLKALRQQ
jgi:shikimate kinase